MRKVLFIAWFVTAVVATRGWAQAPQIQVVPPVAPQTVAPATIQMIEAIRANAQRPIAVPVVDPSTIAMIDSIRAVAEAPRVFTIVSPTPIDIVPISPTPEQTPAPAAPAAPRPARPAPGSAPAAPVPQAAPPPPAAPPAKPVPPAPARLIAPRNVRFDIAITDSGGPKPVTKVVSVTVADNNASGSIRSVARLSPVPEDMYPLNLDVRAVMGFDDGSVRASVNVEYQPYIPDAKMKPGAITASATAVFQDGRKTQILQSTDPLSDRRTTVEVTATILK